MSTLLAIEDYHLAIPTFDGPARVLNGIDLALAEGETLGIVGESGCGKTVLARTILGIGPGRAERTAGASCSRAATSGRSARATGGACGA